MKNNDLITLKNSISIVEESCDSFDKAYGKKLIDKYKLEVFMFNMFYTWMFLRENNIIDENPENVNIFISLGYEEFLKTDMSLPRDKFDTIYNDRIIHYKKEFPEFVKGIKDDEIFIPHFFSEMRGNGTMSFELRFLSPESDLIMDAFFDLICQLEYKLDKDIKNSCFKNDIEILNYGMVSPGETARVLTEKFLQLSENKNFNKEAVFREILTLKALTYESRGVFILNTQLIEKVIKYSNSQFPFILLVDIFLTYQVLGIDDQFMLNRMDIIVDLVLYNYNSYVSIYDKVIDFRDIKLRIKDFVQNELTFRAIKTKQGM